MASALAEASEPWWLIGSAAVALHCAHPISIADVDVLLGEVDARRVCTNIGIEPMLGTSDVRFRSSLLAKWSRPPVPVEFMVGTEVFARNRWHSISLRTREAVGRGLFVPSRAELIELLTLFGRAKDLRRAASLRQ